MEIVERGERAARMLLVWRCKVTSCHVVTRTTYTWWPQRQPLDCLAMPHLLGLTSLAHCRPRSLFLGIVSSKNFTGTSQTRDSRAARANRFHLASLRKIPRRLPIRTRRVHSAILIPPVRGLGRRRRRLPRAARRSAPRAGLRLRGTTALPDIPDKIIQCETHLHFSAHGLATH